MKPLVLNQLEKCLVVILLVLIASLATGRVEAGVVGIYTFEGNANDVSGNGNHGVLPANGVIQSVDGYEGNAYAFDGANGSFITLPININPSAMPQMTMGAWVKATSLDDRAIVMTHDNGGFDRGFGYNDAGPGDTTDWSAFNGSSVSDTDNLVIVDQWVFLAVVYDGVQGSMTFYNGAALLTFAEIDQATFPANPSQGNSELYVGASPAFNEYFTGLIDNVFIYDIALAPEDIETIFNEGVTTIVPETSVLPVLALAALLVIGWRVRGTRRLQGRLSR